MCLSQGVQKWHVVTYSNYLFSPSLGNLTGQSLIKHHTYRSGYLHEQDCWFHIPKTWTSVPAGKCSCILCWPGLQRLSSSPKPTARAPRVSPQIKGTILRELPTVWKTFVWKAELHIWNRGYHLGIRSAHVHLNALILKIKSHDILFQCICRVSDSSVCSCEVWFTELLQVQVPLKLFYCIISWQLHEDDLKIFLLSKGRTLESVICVRPWANFHHQHRYLNPKRSLDLGNRTVFSVLILALWERDEEKSILVFQKIAS